MHNPAPQTPSRSQQHPQGSPAVTAPKTPSRSQQQKLQLLRSSVTLEVSGHGLQTTTATNLTSGAPQGDQYWTAADHDFFQSDEFAQFEDTVYSPPNRYVTQSRSSNGKLAYVVFAGHDIGVFYNWAACSAATSGFSNKVYKGFGSYNEAHSVWHDFANRNVLPPDVLIGLNGRPAPLPPTVSQPNIGGLADPPFKSPLQAPATIGSPRRPIVTPFFNCSQAEEAFKMPSALCTRSPAHDGLTLKIEATLPAATQNLVGSRKASDAEDFWVVLTGTSPGVYKGREGEHALGPLASPSFLRIGSREEANQIFVNEYMGLRVARFT